MQRALAAELHAFCLRAYWGFCHTVALVHRGMQSSWRGVEDLLLRRTTRRGGKRRPEARRRAHSSLVPISSHLVPAPILNARRDDRQSRRATDAGLAQNRGPTGDPTRAGMSDVHESAQTGSTRTHASAQGEACALERARGAGAYSVVSVPSFSARVSALPPTCLRSQSYVSHTQIERTALPPQRTQLLEARVALVVVVVGGGRGSAHENGCAIWAAGEEADGADVCRPGARVEGRRNPRVTTRSRAPARSVGSTTPRSATHRPRGGKSPSAHSHACGWRPVCAPSLHPPAQSTRPGPAGSITSAGDARSETRNHAADASEAGDGKRKRKMKLQVLAQHTAQRGEVAHPLDVKPRTHGTIGGEPCTTKSTNDDMCARSPSVPDTGPPRTEQTPDPSLPKSGEQYEKRDYSLDGLRHPTLQRRQQRAAAVAPTIEAWRHIPPPPLLTGLMMARTMVCTHQGTLFCSCGLSARCRAALRRRPAMLKGSPRLQGVEAPLHDVVDARGWSGGGWAQRGRTDVEAGVHGGEAQDWRSRPRRMWHVGDPCLIRVQESGICYNRSDPDADGNT
ncbi:hypothetical protein B0H10DRAFT_2428777 [Mycena sp. CBHHK59/15]|nr:hypothetical protein B0H10DRAFT_2428777 [Mycena sp. CBHHK59/15]